MIIHEYIGLSFHQKCSVALQMRQIRTRTQLGRLRRSSRLPSLLVRRNTITPIFCTSPLPIYPAGVDACSVLFIKPCKLSLIRFRFRRRMSTNGHFRRTFGFGRKQSYHIRCTFGFGVLQLVNSVVAERRVDSLSCKGRECAKRKESLACVLTDYVKITEEAGCAVYICIWYCGL